MVEDPENYKEDDSEWPTSWIERIVVGIKKWFGSLLLDGDEYAFPHEPPNKVLQQEVAKVPHNHFVNFESEPE